MSRSQTLRRYQRKIVATPHGEITYIESGSGNVALFLHGVFLNASLWVHQLEDLSDLRRCIAVDLLGHGESGFPVGADVTTDMQADMVLSFLDALDVEAVDLIGNDSGGAVAQVVATRAPQRIRTLTLTDCDTHDNWPPPAGVPLHELAEQGLLADALTTIGSDLPAAREALKPGLENPELLPDEFISEFFQPYARSPERARAVQSYLASADNAVTVAIHDDLTKFSSPTLIVWGAADDFFDVYWAHWLANTIPGTVRCVELEGAKLFHPLERPELLNHELRRFWSSSPAARVVD